MDADLCKYKAACAHNPQNARKTPQTDDGAGFDAIDKNTDVFRYAKMSSCAPSFTSVCCQTVYELAF